MIPDNIEGKQGPSHGANLELAEDESARNIAHRKTSGGYTADLSSEAETLFVAVVGTLAAEIGLKGAEEEGAAVSDGALCGGE